MLRIFLPETTHVSRCTGIWCDHPQHHGMPCKHMRPNPNQFDESLATLDQLSSPLRQCFRSDTCTCYKCMPLIPCGCTTRCDCKECSQLVALGKICAIIAFLLPFVPATIALSAEYAWQVNVAMSYYVAAIFSVYYLTKTKTYRHPRQDVDSKENIIAFVLAILGSALFIYTMLSLKKTGNALQVVSVVVLFSAAFGASVCLIVAAKIMSEDNLSNNQGHLPRDKMVLYREGAKERILATNNIILFKLRVLSTAWRNTNGQHTSLPEQLLHEIYNFNRTTTTGDRVLSREGLRRWQLR